MKEVDPSKSLTANNLEQSWRDQVEEEVGTKRSQECPHSTLPPVKLLKESSRKQVTRETLGRPKLTFSSWSKVEDSSNNEKNYSKWLTTTKMVQEKLLNLRTKEKNEMRENGPINDCEPKEDAKKGMEKSPHG